MTSLSIMGRKAKSTMYSSDKGVICLTAFHGTDKQGFGSGYLKGQLRNNRYWHGPRCIHKLFS
jgi:hypothetical protein